MSFASSNRTTLQYIAEATIGTTPATPLLTAIRYTGESLNYNLTNIVSNEIRSDRMTADLIQTGSDASGDINFEMSAVAFDDFIEAACGGAWTTNVVKNGTTLYPFSIQKQLNDSTAITYITFTGCCVNSLNLNVEAGAILTGSLNFMALAAAVSETQITGATFASAPTKDVLNCVSNVTSIKEDDVESTNSFKTLTISMSNNIRAQDAIGSLPHVGLSLGKVDLTGNISVYFEDKSILDKYLAATAFSIEFTVADAAGNTYVFKIPKAKLETGQVVSGGLDTDLMFEGTWRAIYDVTDDSMIVITRTLI